MKGRGGGKGCQNDVMLIISRLMRELNLKKIFRVHAAFCILLGVFLFFIPRTFFVSVLEGGADYDHMQHEYIRLYGVLNVSIGWLIWKLRDVTDGRIGQAIAEAFAVCYVLQFIVMLRAQFGNPRGHSLSHWTVAIFFAVLAYAYTYIRFFKKIKYFELPGHHDK